MARRFNLRAHKTSMFYAAAIAKESLSQPKSARGSPAERIAAKAKRKTLSHWSQRAEARCPRLARNEGEAYLEGTRARS